MPQPSDTLLVEKCYTLYYSRRTKYSNTAFPKELFFRDFLQKNSAFLPKGRRFKALELGAGSGDFIKAFNALYPNAEITAVEMNEENKGNFASMNCRLISSSIEAYLGTCNEKFDVVFLFDVLEHLRDPARALGQIEKLLDASGCICLTVPLANSTLHNLTGRFWPQYKLEHLFYYSESSFNHLGGKAGLTVVHFSPLSKKLPLSYLLSVGSEFGPGILPGLIRFFVKFIPKRLYELNVRLVFGEACVFYAKNGK